jgi:hypothetical protein
MTIRLTFPLATVIALIDHATGAAAHLHPAGTDTTGPALLLRSDTNGVHLTSNGLPTPPAPAGQPGTVDRLAAFAQQCPPGTPWLEQIQLLRSATPLTQVLPLHQPQRHPLHAQLHAGATAGYTTMTVLLDGTGISVAIGRRRERTHQPIGR